MNATTSLSFMQLLIKGLISSYRINVTAGVLLALAFSLMLSVSWFSSYWLITRQLCYTVNICNQRPQHISPWNAFTHRQKAYDVVITFIWQKKPPKILKFPSQSCHWCWSVCLYVSVYIPVSFSVCAAVSHWSQKLSPS